MKKNSRSQKLFKAALATSVATGALVMAVPTNTNAETNSYTDVKADNQHYKSIMNLSERGIIKGYADGTFRPYKSLTRGQASKIIALSLNLDTVNVKNPGFTDVDKSNGYYGAIAALVEAGIVKGYEEDKTFRPNNFLTRAQMAKIINIGFGLGDAELPGNTFVDVKSTDYFAGYVQTLLKHKITTGTTATTYSPYSFVTRGQMASFVVRTETAIKPPVVTPPVVTPPVVTPPVVTPPEVITGNTLLNQSLIRQEDEGNAATGGAVKVKLTDATFNVQILDGEKTLKDFKDDPLTSSAFGSFKADNIIVNKVVATYSTSSNDFVITDNNVNNAGSFGEVIAKALAKVNLAEDTKIKVLAGKSITFKIEGTIGSGADMKPFNDTYTFNFVN